MCVYAVEAIIYFQREEIQKGKNIKVIRLRGSGPQEEDIGCRNKTRG